MSVKTSDARKLAELIKDIRVAMFATNQTNKDWPHVRPMYTTACDPDTFDGDLWFMTSKSSTKVSEIEKDQRVVLTYADYGKNRFVAVMGLANVEKNAEKAKELWNVHAKGWYPEGPSDPDLMLIRVRVESAEYWDGPSKTAYMLSLAQALLTHEKVKVKTGEHGAVVL
jgi:general stress protein 26